MFPYVSICRCGLAYVLHNQEESCGREEVARKEDELLKAGRGHWGERAGVGEKREEEAKPQLFENAKMKSNVLYVIFSKEGEKIHYL